MHFDDLRCIKEEEEKNGEEKEGNILRRRTPYFLEEKKNREGKGIEYLKKISPKIAKDIEKSWFRSRSRDLCKFLEGFAFAFGDFYLGKGTSP